MNSTAAHPQDAESAPPPLTLPITRDGLVLTDRVCWAILGMAMIAAAGLILWLNRGTTFFLDELNWVYSAPSFSLGEVIEPHNGHLVATSRLAYKAILETVGSEYVAIRLLALASVLLSAGFFYALVKRRIGALGALAPTLVLLFLGSAWQHVVVGVGFTIIFSVAAGLAALLALDRGDRRGDVAACALLILSVATYTTGLAFLAGIAISVLVRPDRRERAWIFVVPLALYAAWWLSSLGAEQSAERETKFSNVLLIPNYVAESLAAVTAAVAGLSYDFERPPFVELGWGRILAALAVVALALRIRRGDVPAFLWVALGIVLTYWALGALAVGPERAPWAVRYMYPGAVGVLLTAVAAATGMRLSKLGLTALFAAAAFSLTANIALLRDGAAVFREYSSKARAQFAMLDLARDHADPAFSPSVAVPDASPVGAQQATYLAVADRYGSLGFTLPELQRQSESVRQGADRILASALALGLEPARADVATAGCERVADSESAGSVTFELPRGGAVIRTRGTAPAAVTVGRFADSTSADVGSLSPGQSATLRIPPDRSPQPWRASAPGVDSVTVCSL